MDLENFPSDPVAVLADVEAEHTRQRFQERDEAFAMLREAGAAELELRHLLARSLGRPIRLVVGENLLSGVLRERGTDWIRLDRSASPSVLVRHAAIEAVAGLAERPDAAVPAPAHPLRSWASVLREKLVERAVLVIRTTGGRQYGGRLDRLGADHLAVGADSERWIVPLRAVAWIQDER